MTAISELACSWPGLVGFLDTDNYRKRVLHKIARELQLPKLTFQVIRRTIATLVRKKGTIKDVQGVMRHSRTAMTTDVYAGNSGKRSVDDQCINLE